MENAAHAFSGGTLVCGNFPGESLDGKFQRMASG